MHKCKDVEAKHKYISTGDLIYTPPLIENPPNIPSLVLETYMNMHVHDPIIFITVKRACIRLY